LGKYDDNVCVQNVQIVIAFRSTAMQYRSTVYITHTRNTKRIIDKRRIFTSACLLLYYCAVPPSVMAEDIRPVFSNEMPNMSGAQFIVVEVNLAPGTKADSHRHGQAVVYAYVLSGEVRSQLEGESARTYLAGQSWFERPGVHHILTANSSATLPARLLVVFIAPAGAPLKISDTPTEPDAVQGHAAPGSPSSSTQVTLAPTPRKMVDALYSAFGDNHSRAVHAKGVMAVGTFEPTDEAVGLSKASIFANGIVPVLVRFSDFTGIPNIPDTVGDANPRGFAIKFQLPNGSSADVISHSFNGFPTATAAEFRELLLAIGASGPNAARPTALDTFLGNHPIAKTFLTTQKPAPVSYATLSYFGVNAFQFTDVHNHKRFVRYRFVPVGGEALLTPKRLAAMGPNYLQTELPARLAKFPIAFEWYAQIAEPTDVIGNPSIAWPESRKLVKLGIIRLMGMAPDQKTTDQTTMFAPLNVPPGIAPADPMLEIRQGAYPLSFEHRQ
jgi:catalase